MTTAYISAAELRIHMVSSWTPDGWTEPRPVTDLRGSPLGERVQVWELDRLVTPRRGRGRRVREYVKVMHCPEGWHSTSGTADAPSGGEICATLLDPKWRGDFPADFNRYHDEHPVVWIVKVRIHKQVRTLRYCDPELPAEYRPDGWVDGEGRPGEAEYVISTSGPGIRQVDL